MSAYRRVLRQACTICPPVWRPDGQVVARYHKHFSSRLGRRECRGVYDCPTCAHPHPPEIQGHLSVCVGASTLHEFWIPMEGGVDFCGGEHHVDYVSLPGATIQEMRLAFLAEYGEADSPMNVLCIPGYNDLLRGAEVQDILQEIEVFKDLVELQAHRYHPSFPNTFGVSTMAYAPRLCRLPGQRMVSPDFEDHFSQQCFINQRVLDMNSSNCLPSLDFSQLGLRWERGHNGVLTARHDFSKWREARPSRMLHFKDFIRIQMAKQIERYFVTLG